MDAKIKPLLHALAVAVLYLVLFAIVTPPLLKVLDKPFGKVVYGILVLGGVGVAVRLRHLLHRL
ncbi:MAG: hypothetical protein KBD85_05420 [Elusimicrobia bacterium]|nr:hypothetical protein [Elusimicrobiota bacterium]MBP9127715.1 hypothetical protein [Elusimicrobiota bacterium]MBP9699439.1 hypothetical protein [Elusimicrobiota bacterium]